jgi:hypothetical protein
MAPAKAMLFSQMCPRPQDVSAFHAWYNTEHVPARMALPEFERARRFQDAEGRLNFLAIYEVAGTHAFTSPGFLALRAKPSPHTVEMLSHVTGLTRFICEEISDTGPAVTGRFLSVNAFDVPAAAGAAFDEWYETEHTPRLMAADDWLRVRRYKIVDGGDRDWTHIAVHEIASRKVMDSPERARARTGPLRDALAAEPWFRDSGRWLYTRIFDTEG